MALETFGSRALAAVGLQEWFEQLLKFQKTIPVVLSVCILLMIPLPGVHSYDISLGLSQECKDRCDNNRQPGWSHEYMLDCVKEYEGVSESINYCKGQCNNCPDSICDRYRDHIFNCPATELDGTCGAYCEQNRNGNLDGFLINCNKAFTDSRDVARCKDVCRQCPLWACDSRMPHTGGNAYYVFHCPAVKYDDKCKTRCEQYRDIFYSDRPWSTGVFEFYCEFLTEPSDISRCKDCEHCDKPVCQKTAAGKIKWKCPSKQGPKPLPTSTTTTSTPPPPPLYEGPCKERCDKFRLGGTDKYILDCSSLFEPGSVDLRKCEFDCNRCPKDVCPSSAGRKRFNCPKSNDHVDWESKYHTVDRERGHAESANITLTWWVVVLAIWFVVSLCVNCLLFSWRQRRGVAMVNPVATMSMQQMQYRPSQMQYQQQQSMNQTPQTSTYNPAFQASGSASQFSPSSAIKK